ncbi:uncharacterized protein LOC101738523 isoform X2 [Bombyx mori]|uniref:uncharacterized protein LOC101738523 isoform X2 n=1 Tax=Bombyx mori TaxID=7091 RepID=UPI002ED222FF
MQFSFLSFLHSHGDRRLGDGAVPSPNFKHMKKYLKCKFGEESHSPQYHAVTEFPEAEAMEKKGNEQTEKVDPPLPNRPPLPPPDPLLANLKKEIVNEEYIDTSSITINIKTDPTENDGKPNDVEETMCRNFVRNTCNRGASCRYLHKIIHSQLKGVYRFCIDFENKKCTRAECSYAHATVHEKEHFFRTGYLPPNTLSHIKKKTVLPQAKTKATTPNMSAPYSADQTFPLGINTVPAYPNTSNMKMIQNPYPGMISPTTRQWLGMEEKTSELSANYSGTTYPHSASTIPMYTNTPNVNVMQNPYARQWPETEDKSPTVMHNPYATVMSPTKRPWTEMEEPMIQPTREYAEYAEATESKKCRNCDVNEFRLQHNKNKIIKMMEDADDLNKRVGQITKKNNKLNEVLVLLIEAVAEHCNPEASDEMSFEHNAAQIMKNVMAAERGESSMSPEDMFYD